MIRLNSSYFGVIQNFGHTYFGLINDDLFLNKLLITVYY